jgi:hypothetical protein
MDVEGGERLPAVAPGKGKSGGADGVAELEACEDLAEDVQGQGDQRVGRHRFRGLGSSGLLAVAGRRHFSGDVRRRRSKRRVWDFRGAGGGDEVYIFTI